MLRVQYKYFRFVTFFALIFSNNNNSIKLELNVYMYEHELCVQWSKLVDNENIYYFLRSQKNTWSRKHSRHLKVVRLLGLIFCTHHDDILPPTLSCLTSNRLSVLDLAYPEFGAVVVGAFLLYTGDEHVALSSPEKNQRQENLIFILDRMYTYINNIHTSNLILNNLKIF